MNSKLGSVRDLAALQNDDGSGPDVGHAGGGSFGALSPARGNARVSIDESAGIKRCAFLALQPVSVACYLYWQSDRCLTKCLFACSAPKAGTQMRVQAV